MDPQYKIIRTLNFSYIKLNKKKSFFNKFPKHRRSSRLCLIAAERDSLRDLNNQNLLNSQSLDSKTSKNIQILNFQNDSEFPIEYKAETSSKIQKDLSLGKIVINKSSRIKEKADSNRKIMKSEVYTMKKPPKEEKDLYWTKSRNKNKYETNGDMNLGYSTLDRSRVIEVSYCPTNQNANIFGDIDSAPKKFFQETIPSKEDSDSNFDNLYEPLTPKAPKTSLSEFSDSSDRIKDFLDQQVQNNLKKHAKNEIPY